MALAAVVVLGVPRAGGAQAPAPQPDVDRQVHTMILNAGRSGGDVLAFAPHAQMEFLTMPIEVAGETATGAPYSAEALTEVVQPLADGNRIVRESRAAVYRDSAGRMRREHGLAVIGGLVSGSGGPQSVQISDPNTGVSYMLDTENRRAVKLAVPKAGAFAAAAASRTSSDVFEIALPPPPQPPPPSPAAGTQAAVFYRAERFEQLAPAVVERLGTQTIEGVTTEGTRSTTTIPAGGIGNEQPILIVSERWFSPELKVLVLSRQSDPRFGETTYRLTKIVRADPPPELFEVPSDFTVVEGGAFGAKAIRIEK
jgi:hypothetical protein